MLYSDPSEDVVKVQVIILGEVIWKEDLIFLVYIW